MRRAQRLGTVAALALGIAVGTAAPAFAHNQLIGSDPSANSTVDAQGRTVTLQFNAPVQDGPNKITVTGPDGKQWQANDGSATVNGNDMSNRLRPLGPAGRYTVGYHVISADGHPLNGSLTFQVGTAGSGTPNPDVRAVSQDEGTGVPAWVWIVGAVVLIGVGLAVALGTGRGERGSGEKAQREADEEQKVEK